MKLFPLVVLIGLFGPLCSKMPIFGFCFKVETFLLRKLGCSELSQALARYRETQFFENLPVFSEKPYFAQNGHGIVIYESTTPVLTKVRNELKRAKTI